MKKLLCALLLMIPLAGTAQTSYPVSLTVLNRNGQPDGNSDIVAFVKGANPVVYTPGQDGTLIIPNVESDDTIAVIIRHRMYEFPAAGTHSLQLNLNRRGKVASALRNDVRISSGDYRTVGLSAASTDVAVNDTNNASQYFSLADYLTGRIPGLVIEGGPGNYQAYLDGVPPLVLLNGMRMMSFNAANNLVNPNDIQSVTVDRNSAIYGTLNGVLLITTK